LQVSILLIELTSIILQTHSKIILLTFLILTPEHNDSHNVKTNYSDSEKLLHNFKQEPRNKAKNRYMNQTCNLHETNQLQK